MSVGLFKVLFAHCEAASIDTMKGELILACIREPALRERIKHRNSTSKHDLGAAPETGIQHRYLGLPKVWQRSQGECYALGFAVLIWVAFILIMLFVGKLISFFNFK
jgi:hypothetical protein